MTRKIRVVGRMSFDSPPKPYYIVEETVTPQGHTIDLPGVYKTRPEAEKAAVKELEKR